MKNEIEAPAQEKIERALGSVVAVASRQTVTITTTVLGLVSLALVALGLGYWLGRRST